MTAFKKSASLGLATLFLLGACGIKGELETPPPMWGKKDAPKAEQKPQE